MIFRLKWTFGTIFSGRNQKTLISGQELLRLIEEGAFNGVDTLDITKNSIHITYFDRDKRILDPYPRINEFEGSGSTVRDTPINPFNDKFETEMTPLEEQAFEELRLSQMMIDSPLEYEKEMMRQFTGRNNND